MLFSLPGAAILDFVWNAAVYRPTVVGIEGEKVRTFLNEFIGQKTQRCMVASPVHAR